MTASKDPAKLAAELTPPAKAAVAAYGTAALTRDAEQGADEKAEHGRDVLQTVYWRAKNVPQLEGAVTDLAERPEDEDAIGELRLQLTKALEGDDVLLAQTTKLAASDGKPTADSGASDTAPKGNEK
jgi:hypothetical protein